jgi:PPP family 3-phenylpropionic acid transporter
LSPSHRKKATAVISPEPTPPAAVEAASEAAAGIALIPPPVAADALPLPVAQRGLTVAKSYYFVYFAAIGGLVSLINIFFQARGLNGTQIGLLAALPPLLAIAANPFWGTLADRTQRHNLVLAVCAGGAGLASLFFLWANGFWAFLVILVAVTLFRSPVGALLDCAVMHLVDQTNASYVRQRAWGSLGFVVGSYGLALLATPFGLEMIFWAHALLIGGVCAALSLRLPLPRKTGHVDLRRGLGSLFRSRPYVSLVVAMVLFGAGGAAYVNFLGLRILQLGGTEQQAGLAFALVALIETPLMFMGGRWFARVSYRRTILLGLLGFALLFALLAVVREPWQVLLVAPIDGICYAVLWPAIVTFADAYAPDGLRASAQTIAQGANAGLGWAIGAALGGVIWDAAGGAALFGMATLFTLAAVAAFAWGARDSEQ